MKSILILLSFLIPFEAFAKTFKSGASQIKMLELFSSEGCNSCPPAEKQLYALRSDPKLWKEFVALNFHVDYWNRLGWVDRFSRDQFTQRQNEYAAAWGVSKIYTPEFVLDGKEVGPGFKYFPSSVPQRVGELVLTTSQGKNAEIKLSYVNNSDREFKVFFAILGNDLESKVTSGENSGQLLKHNFVVLYLAEKELIFNKKINHSEVQFDWPKLKEGPSSLSVVAWVINKKSLQYEQAVGGDL